MVSHLFDDMLVLFGLLTSQDFRNQCMVPVLKKFPHLFLTISKMFLLSLVSCEDFHWPIALHEIPASVDGLQIRVNLANPKLKSLFIVTAFDSNRGIRK